MAGGQSRSCAGSPGWTASCPARGCVFPLSATDSPPRGSLTERRGAASMRLLGRVRKLAPPNPHRVNLSRVADIRKGIRVQDEKIGPFPWLKGVPRSASSFIARAASPVAATSTCIGVRPAFTISSSSSCSK